MEKKIEKNERETLAGDRNYEIPGVEVTGWRAMKVMGITTTL